jgi:hypothetical protein
MRERIDMALPAAVQSHLHLNSVICAQLDEKALEWLRKVDVGRAIEIIDELAAKDNVRNPSAFVSKAASNFPMKRGRAGDVDDILARYTDIRDSLDDNAVSKLREANPARAVEIIEEVASKEEIRNPSAFIAKALSTHPLPRGASGAIANAEPVSLEPSREVEEALARLLDSGSTLDDRALSAMRLADADRALEIVDDLVAKGAEVRNPSAFVSRALKDFPHRRSAPDVEAVLEKFAHLESVRALDDKALAQLREADAARAAEILEDLAGKWDVRNPSAFISMALSKFPRKRTGAEPVAMPRFAFGAVPFATGPVYQRQRGGGDHIDQALMRAPPHIRNSLDEGALRILREADVGRALEIIEDVVSKGDVRNPSAFIMKAVGKFPQQRGGGGGGGGGVFAQGLGRVRGVVQDALSRHPTLARLLDDSAIRQLQSADPGRAREVIEDMAAKSISDLRNPSAFVATALRNFPSERGQQYMAMPSARATPHHEMTDLDQALARFPRIARALDDEAVQRLQSAELARAVEIIEDAAAKSDIRNPSAFVCKALAEHPHKRGRENAGFDVRDDSRGNAKRQRTGSASVEDSLDDRARDALNNSDPERAREILEELESMGSTVRNPNAFVTKALSQYPMPRGRNHL